MPDFIPAASVTTQTAALNAFLCTSTFCIRVMSLFYFVCTVTNIILLHQLCLTTFPVFRALKNTLGLCVCCCHSQPVFTPLNLSSTAGKIPCFPFTHIPATPAWNINACLFCGFRSTHTTPERMNQPFFCSMRLITAPEVH